MPTFVATVIACVMLLSAPFAYGQRAGKKKAERAAEETADAPYHGKKLREMSADERSRLAAAARAKRGLVVGQYVQTDEMLRNTEGKVAWFYTYRLHPRGHFGWANRNKVEFVPMQWGSQVIGDGSGSCSLAGPDGKPLGGGKLCEDGVKAIVAAVSAAAAKLDVKPKYLLGFNEPWGENQSNLDPKTAAWLWGHYLQPAAQALGLALVSPTVAAHKKSKQWFAEFLKACHDDGTCKVESIKRLSLHMYQCRDQNWLRQFHAKGFNEDMARELGRHGGANWDSVANLPIWITETNCNHEFEKTEPVQNNAQTCQRATAQVADARWRSGSLVMMASIDRIERFSWWTTYNASGQENGKVASLINGKGELTPAGKAYIGFPEVTNDTCAPLPGEPDTAAQPAGGKKQKRNAKDEDEGG